MLIPKRSLANFPHVSSSPRDDRRFSGAVITIASLHKSAEKTALKIIPWAARLSSTGLAESPLPLSTMPTVAQICNGTSIGAPAVGKDRPPGTELMRNDPLRSQRHAGS
jgi:hypothetical protein